MFFFLFFLSRSICSLDMAEGAEDTENNNNNNHTGSCEVSVMLGAVMPSLAASVNFGAIKKELESACITSHIRRSPSSEHSDSRDRHHRDLKSEVSKTLFFILNFLIN